MSLFFFLYFFPHYCESILIPLSAPLCHRGMPGMPSMSGSLGGGMGGGMASAMASAMGGMAPVGQSVVLIRYEQS